MTLVKTVTLKLNEGNKAIFCDLANLIEGDELFLNKTYEEEFEIFSPDGYSLISFNNELDLKNQFGYNFDDFESCSFEVRQMNDLNELNNQITLTIKFDVHDDVAC